MIDHHPGDISRELVYEDVLSYRILSYLIESLHATAPQAAPYEKEGTELFSTVSVGKMLPGHDLIPMSVCYGCSVGVVGLRAAYLTRMIWWMVIIITRHRRRIPFPTRNERKRFLLGTQWHSAFRRTHEFDEAVQLLQYQLSNVALLRSGRGPRAGACAMSSLVVRMERRIWSRYALS